MTAPLSPGEAGRGSISLRTLVVIRWIAVAGQTLTVGFVDMALGLALPLTTLFGIIALLAVFNIFLSRFRRRRLHDDEAAAILGFDVIQLATLLYFTGGLTNPFAVLLLAPTAVASSVLSRRSVLFVSGLVLGAVGLLAVLHRPLPWAEGVLSLPGLYTLGIWTALSLACLFIVAYVGRVADESRRISDALAAMQSALEREQRLSAVGALAAAAAHELGSPLSTIKVAVQEMRRDVEPGTPLAEDVDLVAGQVDRCSQILHRLAQETTGQDRGTEEGGPFGPLDPVELIEEAALPYRRPEVRLKVRQQGGLMRLRRAPELMHGLANLLQNAIQFARSEVEVVVDRPEGGLAVSIIDDGPGFPETMLDRIGEPYISTRTRENGHLGLGLFIAQTLLERTGAVLRFEQVEPSPARPSGAQVTIVWTASALGQYSLVHT